VGYTTERAGIAFVDAGASYHAEFSPDGLTMAIVDNHDGGTAVRREHRPGYRHAR
jgi:hypothetical protein